MLSNLQSSCEDNRRNCIHASRRTWRNYVPKMDFLIMYRKISQYNIALLICLLKKSRVTSAHYNTNKKNSHQLLLLKKLQTSSSSSLNSYSFLARLVLLTLTGSCSMLAWYKLSPSSLSSSSSSTKSYSAFFFLDFLLWDGGGMSSVNSKRGVAWASFFLRERGVGAGEGSWGEEGKWLIAFHETHRASFLIH